MAGASSCSASCALLHAPLHLPPERSIDLSRRAGRRERRQRGTAQTHTLDLTPVGYLRLQNGRALAARARDELRVKGTAHIDHGEEWQQQQIRPTLLFQEL